METQNPAKLDERTSEVKAHAPEHELISEPKLFEKPTRLGCALHVFVGQS
jgi:hypothetical protein